MDLSTWGLMYHIRYPLLCIIMGSNKSNYKELQTCIAVKPQYCDGVNWMVKTIRIINTRTL